MIQVNLHVGNSDSRPSGTMGIDHVEPLEVIVLFDFILSRTKFTQSQKTDVIQALIDLTHGVK
jgi:CRISPR/Cas system type I-B associated protein Csh2 (Cas7 group RAMP superfamily)